jgi:hypothetical protein
MTQEEKNKKNEYMRLYRSNNKEKIKGINKKYRTGETREKYLENKKQAYEKNKEKIRNDQKDYYLKNKNKLNESSKKNYEKNKEKCNLQSKSWRENNSERDKELKKIWYEKNKHKRPKQIKERKKKDPLFKLKSAISTRIRNGIKSTGFSKNFKTKEILGCTYEDFKDYLESKWESWMNWDNYGLYNGELNYGWDLDHIIPLNTAKTEEDVIKLNHYINFQPLCSKVNRDIKWKN